MLACPDSYSLRKHAQRTCRTFSFHAFLPTHLSVHFVFSYSTRVLHAACAFHSYALTTASQWLCTPQFRPALPAGCRPSVYSCYALTCPMILNTGLSKACALFYDATGLAGRHTGRLYACLCTCRQLCVWVLGLYGIPLLPTRRAEMSPFKSAFGHQGFKSSVHKQGGGVKCFVCSLCSFVLIASSVHYVSGKGGCGFSCTGDTHAHVCAAIRACKKQACHFHCDIRDGLNVRTFAVVVLDRLCLLGFMACKGMARTWHEHSL